MIGIMTAKHIARRLLGGEEEECNFVENSCHYGIGDGLGIFKCKGPREVKHCNYGYPRIDEPS
jgi:hypothetical protein